MHIYNNRLPGVKELWYNSMNFAGKTAEKTMKNCSSAFALTCHFDTLTIKIYTWYLIHGDQNKMANILLEKRILINISLRFIMMGPAAKNVGSNHSLVPNRQQAIIWTNGLPSNV